jgi:hypothetical protein
MLDKILSKKRLTYIFFLFLIFSSFVLYTLAGVVGREVFKDAPFYKGWTADTGNKLLDVWSVWDSGSYNLIATQDYPDLSKVDYKKTYIEVPSRSWVKVYIGYAEIGSDHEVLPFSTEVPFQNVVFLINDSDISKEVPFYFVQAGLPYCNYSGPIDYERDVLSDSPFANDTGGVSYITYYDAFLQKTTFKEEFYAFPFPSHLITIFGENRPKGITTRPSEGFGCSAVKESDLLKVTFKPYLRSVSPFPFLPLYPMLIRLANNIFSNYILSGVVISGLSLILASIFLYELLSAGFSKKLGFFATIFYLISPLSFIFHGVMTESLFNMILFAILLSTAKGKYLLANILVAFLAITRVPGILICFVLFYLYLKNFSGRKLLLSLGSLAALGPSLLLLHIYKLYTLTGNWFVILDAQKAFGRGEKSLFSSFWGYFEYGMPYALFEFVFFVISLGLIVWFLRSYLKKNGVLLWDQVIYSFYSFIVPFSSGSFTSFPRYTLTIFPVFIFVGWFLEYSKMNKWMFFGLSFVLSLFGMAFWSVGSRFFM